MYVKASVRARARTGVLVESDARAHVGWWLAGGQSADTIAGCMYEAFLKLDKALRPAAVRADGRTRGLRRREGGSDRMVAGACAAGAERGPKRVHGGRDGDHAH